MEKLRLLCSEHPDASYINPMMRYLAEKYSIEWVNSKIDDSGHIKIRQIKAIYHTNTSWRAKKFRNMHSRIGINRLHNDIEFREEFEDHNIKRFKRDEYGDILTLADNGNWEYAY